MDKLEEKRGLSEGVQDVVQALMGGEARPAHEVLRYYVEARKSIAGLETRGAAVSPDLKAALANAMNSKLPAVVAAICEGAEREMAQAGSFKDRYRLVRAATRALEPLERFPEHAGRPELKKAMAALGKHASEALHALAGEEEEEFRREIAGITFTATEKQIRYLLNLGAEPQQLDGITEKQASVMIGRLIS